MLPCVCSVIDHRWRQTVIRTKKVEDEAIADNTNVLTTFWRPLWSVTEQTTWNLFDLYNKETSYYSIFYFKIFQLYSILQLKFADDFAVILSTVAFTNNLKTIWPNFLYIVNVELPRASVKIANPVRFKSIKWFLDCAIYNNFDKLKQLECCWDKRNIKTMRFIKGVTKWFSIRKT